MARERTRHSLDGASRTALRRSAALLGQAAELASVGSWEIDLEKKELRWSPQFFRIVGIPPRKQPMRPDFWVGLIHPDDREAALKRIDVLQRDGTPMESEVRFVTPNRGVRIFRTRSVAVQDKSGKIVRIRGMTQDVTEQRAAEQALREREAMLSHAEQIANVGSWQYDCATQRSTLSPNLLRIFGVAPGGEWTSERYWSRMHPQDREWIRPYRDSCIAERRPFEYEARFQALDGRELVHHVRGLMIFDTEGNPVRRVGVVQDITKWREADEKLREREAMLAHAEEIADLGSFQFDICTQKATLSPNLRKIFGLRDGEEWNPEACWERVHAGDRNRVRESMARGTESGKPFTFVMRFTPPGGAMRYLQVRGSPQSDSAAKVTQLIGIVQDITEQREIEESLRERQALLAHAEHIANFGSWQLDLATDRITLSPYLMEYYGLSTGDKWTRELVWSRVHPEDQPSAQLAMQQAMEERRSFDFVARCVPPAGGVRFVRFRGEPLIDAEGKPVRRVGVVQDITEQREAEEKLRERSALIEYAEKVAKLASWRYDYATDSFTLSPNMRQILGIGPDDSWSSELYWSRVPSEDRARAQAIFERATLERKPFEFIARFAPMNGGMAHLYTRGITFCDTSGKLTYRVGVVQDITEQYEVQQKMREREALLAQAEEISNLGSWKYEFETDTLTLSAQLRQIYGLGENEAWTNDVYWSRVHPADRERVRQMVERATRERSGFECLARFVSVGGEVRHMHLRAVPVHDAAGQLVRRVGIAQDITDQVRAEEELRRLSQQLMRTQDDERRHIARELHETAGQSLAALKMTLGRLRDTMRDADDLAHALLKSASELADGATREVRTISYLMHPPMLDEAGLGPALRWYARGFSERSGVSVRTEIPEALPRQSQEVETTIFRIVQEALTNVHRYSQSATALIRLWCQNGDIHAEVRDNGRGFIEKHPTSREAEALGVGIAGMRERVAQLRGQFQLHSTLGEGTMVHVALPSDGQRVDASESSVTRMPARSAAARKAT